MKRRFILYRRKLGGTFYVEDTEIHDDEIRLFQSAKDSIEFTPVIQIEKAGA